MELRGMHLSWLSFWSGFGELAFEQLMTVQSLCGGVPWMLQQAFHGLGCRRVRQQR